MKGELRRAGCCDGFVAQWLWRLQSDTLGSSPAVVGFSIFSFLLEQVGFQLTSIIKYTIAWWGNGCSGLLTSLHFNCPYYLHDSLSVPKSIFSSCSWQSWKNVTVPPSPTISLLNTDNLPPEYRESPSSIPRISLLNTNNLPPQYQQSPFSIPTISLLNTDNLPPQYHQSPS